MLPFGPRIHCFALSLAIVLAASAASAQGAHDMPGPAMTPAANPSVEVRAEHRFPQPVRVGDLTDRLVIDPTEHQRALGHVDGLVRTADGGLDLIVRYGGLFDFGGRKIAVPIGATALLGQFVQIVGLDQHQLNALPTWTGTGAAAVSPDTEILYGINRN